MNEEYYRISPLEYKRTQILKYGEVFLNSAINGEIPPGNLAGLGLYWRDIRYLSCLEMEINNTKPLFLSSDATLGYFAQFELANWEFVLDGKTIPNKSIHIRILRVIKERLYNRIRFINFTTYNLHLPVKLTFGADFLDIFEVRGTKRERHGTINPPRKNEKSIVFSYNGLDGIERKTEILFANIPEDIKVREDNLVELHYNILLPPQKKVYLSFEISIGSFGNKRRRVSFSNVSKQLRDERNKWEDSNTRFESVNEIYNRIISQALNDIYILRNRYPNGSIPIAGIPWFASPFGRDSLIFSLQTLIVNTEIARDTLLFLAQYQGEKIDEFTEEEPGKIMHELRFGEMANCKEIPHYPYYGSIDSTLLFLILVGELYHWTTDKDFLKKLLPAIEKAVKWMRKYGDLDNDGFIEYIRRSPKGLINQGWRDSSEAIVDKKGKTPKPPIALSEVQAYSYLSKKRTASVFRFLGKEEYAKELEEEAEKLKKRFIEKFWIKKEGIIAFGLDGRKKPFSPIVSSAGYSLFGEILDKNYASQVVKRLFQPDMYSGWGIRTMSKLEKSYNPMSYHRGSIWPHDNSIIALGLKKYGFVKELDRLVTGFYEASLHFEYCRLPELFCGFTRRPNHSPVLYPLACPIQAWATGSIFAFLQAMLGIFPKEGELKIINPNLPVWLDRICLKNLRVGKGIVDLEFFKEKNKTVCRILKEENVKVEIVS